TVSDRTRAALAALKSRGVKLCACTGRPLCVTPTALEEIGFDYVITCNGASCVERATGEHVFHAWLSAGEARIGWEIVRQVDALIGWFTGDGIVMDRHHFSTWEERLRPHWHRKYFSEGRVKVYDDIEEFFAEGAPKLEKLNMYTVTPDTPEKVIEPLSKLPAFYATSSLGRNLEITSSKANKGEALLTLCRRLNITPAQTAAFGDGANDIEMLSAAGFGVAMGNAKDPVRLHAAHHTLTNEEDGVAAWLEENVL
ncbi:MAG: HAD family hydrolase, partial [Eubacteriales bacterium]|nr:HAD family hydrolase [Eubacteriales bacterium]